VCNRLISTSGALVGDIGKVSELKIEGASDLAIDAPRACKETQTSWQEMHSRYQSHSFARIIR
jgi:hypothetical protein